MDEDGRLMVKMETGRSLYDLLPSVILVISVKGLVIYMNRTAEQVLGMPEKEALGMALDSLPVKWDWPLLWDDIARSLMEPGSAALPDIKYSTRNGRDGILGATLGVIREPDNSVLGILIYGNDITEKRNRERMFIQTAKMATIGEMATGIAHEMNQPLNIMKMSAQRLDESVREGYQTDSFVLERTGVILGQIERLSGIIGHLRVFGRFDNSGFSGLDPNEPVRNSFALLGEQLKQRSIDVRLKLAEDLPWIMGSSVRLEQVFINLIVNARDALDEMKAGDRVIFVTSVYDGGSGMVLIEFSDNGPGIPPELLERVFEPFYTTKEAGKGTGLGLSISASIISEHKGAIRAEPGPAGVKFIITLPIKR